MQTITIANSDNSVSNTYEVNLGKNLINYNSTGSGKEIDFTFSGSELTLDGTTNASGEIATTSTQPITLQAGTYTFSSTKTGSFTANSKSVAIYLKKVSDNTSIINLNQGNSYTLESSFTLTEETKVYVQIYTNGAGFVFDNLKIQWQIEKGSTATPYSPYFTPIELNKIGTNEDRIYKDSGKWYLEKNIGKVVLNGSENWTNFTTVAGSSNTMSQIDLPMQFLNRDGYTDRFPVIPDYSATEHFVIAGGLTHLYVHILNSRLSTLDVAGFKSWLASNNTTFYYVLKTPTTTEITNTELIEDLENLYKAIGYDNQTNISSNGSLPVVISASMIKGAV